MTEKMETPITQEQWRKLKPGDKINDVYKRAWEITARDWNGDPDRLFARCLDYQHEDRLDWKDGQIFEEEWAIIIELNHPSVTVTIV